MHSVRVTRSVRNRLSLELTTCFHKEMISLVLCGVLVACTSLKTMTTDKLCQRIDYDCMSIYTQSLKRYQTRLYLKQRQNVTKVALFVLLNKNNVVARAE